MPEPPTPIDLKRLAAEVSAQHGIRIDPDDPMMAVVTLNRLVFEQAVAQVLDRVQSAVRDFEAATEKVQVRAGGVLAQEVRECAVVLREEIAKAATRPLRRQDCAGPKAPRLPPCQIGVVCRRSRTGVDVARLRRLAGHPAAIASGYSETMKHADVLVLARGAGTKGKACFPGGMRGASVRSLSLTAMRPRGVCCRFSRYDSSDSDALGLPQAQAQAVV